MAQAPSAAGTAGLIRRVAGAWRELAPDQRLAGIAGIGLFLSLFVPWYQHTVIATVPGKGLAKQTDTLTAWGAFSFVEAAVLLMSAFVLWLLISRGEGRAFHLPFGDGLVMVGAGGWTAVLVVWRMFDREGTDSAGAVATSYTIEWGIFAALAMAVLLAYAGSRIHAAHRPEPPLLDDRADRPAAQVTTETPVLPVKKQPLPAASPGSDGQLTMPLDESV